MKAISILSLAAQFAHRLIQVRRGTWIVLGLGFLMMLFLLGWAALSLLVWLWGQGKSLTEGAPEAVRSIASRDHGALRGARRLCCRPRSLRKGFRGTGFAQNLISASPETEAHDYLKGNERGHFEIARLPQGKVKATIVAVLP